MTQFVKKGNKNYKTNDVKTFIEAFRNATKQYYADKNDVCKDAVSNTCMSMTYVLNKSLEKNKELELYMIDVEINKKSYEL